MNESTQSGDSPVVTDVDSAAAALLSRYEARQSQPEEETQSTPETDEVETEEVDTEEVEETEETEQSDPESEDAEEEEAETFETLDQIAEAAGMEVEDFLKTIKARTKVNGEESEKSLAEIIKGYQLESDYTRKNEAFLKQQKEWDQQREQAQNQLHAEMQRTGQAFQLAQQQLTHEFNAIDWQKLEKESPQDYMYQRQKLGERQAQLDQAINRATQQVSAKAEQQKQEQQQRIEQYTQQQDELLLKAMPEWKKPEVRQEQSQQISEFLMSNGYTPEEINSIRDHRVILMARNAMKGAKSVTDSDLALKKVKKAPKLVKPNARLNSNQANAKTTSKLIQKAKQTGRTEDVAAALLSRRR